MKNRGNIDPLHWRHADAQQFVEPDPAVVAAPAHTKGTPEGQVRGRLKAGWGRLKVGLEQVGVGEVRER